MRADSVADDDEDIDDDDEADTDKGLADRRKKTSVRKVA